MMHEGPIPSDILKRQAYKRKFSVQDLYRGIMLVPEAVSGLKYNRKHKVVSTDFLERMQLAVTEVNGCAACSYAHAHMALKQGISSEEIYSLLSGDGALVRPEEGKAIMFAQHFANTGGFPDIETYRTIETTYGINEARVMLSAIRMMQVGNIYGIPFSAFISRLKGHPYHGSSFFYELGMQVLSAVLLPFALLHGVVRLLIKGRNGLPTL
nr:carboxymuconolactone decarboxylase family protein [uncultured Sphaerochaeta sp.]